MLPVVASTHPGMGALLHDGVTTFRVWAPHADQVYVSGSFNQWSRRATPLASEGNGYWSADVASARAEDQYEYVLVNGDAELPRIDPYAQHVTNSVGKGIIYDGAFDWGDQAWNTPQWHELVIYELHVGTFNDQVGGPPGNFDGVIVRLPYLADLGINAIQIMPPMEFAGDYSWGYNPAYIFSIENEYGGPTAFKQLVKAAHASGIAVIFDVVYNHLGPSDLDLWQFDGWSENGKGGIYFYNDWRSNTPWGDTRPDYGRGEVRSYLRDNALMWIEEFRVDGLRWDATAYIRNFAGNNEDPGNDLPDGWSLMAWINDEINARQPWKITIAEDLRNNPWITSDTGAGGTGFDAQWDGGFVHPIRAALIAADDAARDMRAVRDAILHHYNDDPFERVIYTESHDEVANGHERLPEEIWPGNAGSWFSRKRSTLGAALVFTAPGIPMIFQGQEFLEDQWFQDQDPIDWSKMDTYAGILAMYRDLIRLRRNWYDTTAGLGGSAVDVFHVNDDAKVLAFQRWKSGGPRDTVVVIVNMANRIFEDYAIGLPRAGLWKLRFNSDWQGYSADFGATPSFDVAAESAPRDGLPFSGTVDIGPYSTLIFSQDA
jgi:1,4-alpha-glucan branching enzyme